MAAIVHLTHILKLTELYNVTSKILFEKKEWKKKKKTDFTNVDEDIEQFSHC